MTFIDTHAHYDDKAFDKDRDEVFRKIREAGCEALINCACDRKSIRTTLVLAKQQPFVYAALGYHPENLKGLEYDDIDVLFDRADGNEKVVAIGEIGLDYHWNASPKQVQQEWFIEQIELAKEMELPIIVHSRDAAEDTLTILEDYDASYCGGVLHAYSGSLEMAKRYLELGFYIGLGGFTTFDNAKKLAAAIPEIPLDRILTETDCPYLAPVPHRGERNDSSNIPYVIRRIAELKGLDPEEVAAQTAANARALFAIK